MELAKVRTEPTPITVDAEETEIEEDIQEFDAEEEAEGQLTVDVYQDKDNIIVQSTVAGVEPDDLEINITNESVTVRGRREKMQKIEDKDYYYQECFWGKFSRSIILPAEVDPEGSKASLKNGVLSVTMPKLVKKRAKKLKVKLD
ncbi:MAG: Protein containing Heat shock protein Hsp20 protein [Candidatus Jorgensenbacteria bacterium GW2011_GWA2_45_13]|uniref:Protein containing Heat shock protein Hsp20 protein n=1 Tax=Candidatus Jorgensenbacteria bacterium GW2011_GWA2_45_13 TaxID=1618662 RepID=A0A0G1L8P1_9BACT|nr:MAG: Protein containing Heat shock protein Hsp20 protein [Candidatus Jorgensenbacteria bacterium GW2011_GWA2_45_13]